MKEENTELEGNVGQEPEEPKPKRKGRPKQEKAKEPAPEQTMKFGKRTPKYLAWCKVYDEKQFEEIVGEKGVHKDHEEEFAAAVAEYQQS